MGYKPKIGDLVEYTDSWNGDRKVLAVVVKVNKDRENNGTINLKLVFNEDKIRNYVFIRNVKLLSKAS
jgi:hypothetical protein